MNALATLDEARNNFLIENYQECLKLLHGLSVIPPEHKVSVEILTFQAYIAQKKYNVVINEIPHSDESSAYHTILLLAKQQAGSLSRDEVVEHLERILTEPRADRSTCAIAAKIFINLGMPKRALAALSQSTDLESEATSVHCLLMLNRIDLAAKVIRRMQDQNEDCLSTQLACAEFYLFQGGDKVEEALKIYQELQERFRPSTLLLNGQAVALIALGRHGEAESLLRQALDLDPSHSASLLNMLSVSMVTGKPLESLNRYMSQVRDCDKSHPFLEALDNMDNSFNELAKSFAPSILG